MKKLLRRLLLSRVFWVIVRDDERYREVEHIWIDAFFQYSKDSHLVGPSWRTMIDQMIQKPLKVRRNASKTLNSD